MRSVVLIIACVIWSYVFISCNGIDDSVVLLPHDYTGPIIIAYDVDDAVQPGKYLVPDESGFIRVPYDDKFGSIDQVKFYVDTTLTENKLNRYYDIENFPTKKKAVYGGQSRVVLSGKNGSGPKLKYTTYCVGSKQDIDDCYLALDSLLLAQ